MKMDVMLLIQQPRATSPIPYTYFRSSISGLTHRQIGQWQTDAPHWLLQLLHAFSEKNAPHREKVLGMLRWTYLLVGYVVSVADSHGPHHPRSSSLQHNHPRGTDGKLMQNDQLLHDKQHIKEDLKEVIHDDAIDKMSPEELEFYYFKIHDADNNTKLDGLEILHAVQHASHDEKGDMEVLEDFESLVELIDGVLSEDDVDNDGFLSYVEYVRGREREETARHLAKHKKT